MDTRLVTGVNAMAEAARAPAPGSFAMVMATGIVSAALRLAGLPRLAVVLLVIAAAGFVVLTAGTCCRAAQSPACLRADLTCPGRAFESFAVAAACAVLGVGLAGAGHPAGAAVLAAAALAAWLAVAGLVPVRLAARRRARPAIGDVNGSWYLWAVATQSLSIAAAFLQAGGLLPAQPAAAAAIAAWLAGVGLYLAITVVVAARLLVAGLGPAGAQAPYWVAMGAASISVLAAAEILRLPGVAAAGGARTVITGVAVTLWAVATALIPVLAALTAARWLRSRSRPGYQRRLWMVVFPVGMYAAAGMQLGTAAALPLIYRVGAVAVWPAAAAWALTFTAMAISPFTGHAARPDAPLQDPLRGQGPGQRDLPAPPGKAGRIPRGSATRSRPR